MSFHYHNMTFKKDFPIFQNNPWLIYLDNGASTQKPQNVIDWVSDFVSKYYANIHRWSYDLSEKSEEYYFESKKKVWEFLNCKSSEVLYSYNSTYGINLVAQALCKSKFLWKWDSVLLGLREHHANVMPWKLLAEEYGFQVKYLSIDENFEIDWDDFQNKYDNTVKVASIWHVSNVTWKIYDVEKIKSKLRPDTFFIVDGSQSFPNMQIDVQKIGCDCFVFTGHKAMAYTWIGGVFLKKEWIKELTPLISWGGAIKDLDVDFYELPTTWSKFEAWTPNIIWAVSLLKSLEYIESIWWIQTIRKHEQEIVKYCLPKFTELSDKVKLIWPKTEDRVAVFSFFIPENKNFNNIWEIFSEQNIAIRCGWHCAYPIHKNLNIPWTCRMSAYIYNDIDDIDKFFEVLKKNT